MSADVLTGRNSLFTENIHTRRLSVVEVPGCVLVHLIKVASMETHVGLRWERIPEYPSHGGAAVMEKAHYCEI